MDMVMKAADVRWIRILGRKLLGALMRGTDVWRGRLSWILFNALLYDDLIGTVTSRHVSKMAVTLFDPPWPKAPVVRKLHGFVFYTSEVIAKTGGKYKIKW